MKKIGKILFLIVLSMLLIFTLSFSVNAEDYDEYDDLDEQETTDNKEDDKTTDKGEDADKNGTEETPKEDEKDEGNKETDTEKDPANKAPNAHPQTGKYETIMFGSLVAISSAAIGLTYRKFKKYNY